MILQRVPVAEIRMADYNPRKDLKPGDGEYEKLDRSISEFGFVQPLVWNKRTGNLVAGHQRLKVLMAQGDAEVMCSIVDMNPDEEKTLNIALNKIRGEWDYEMLASVLEELRAEDIDVRLTGFSEEQVDRLLELDGGDGGGEGQERDNPAKKVKGYRCPSCGHKWEH